MATAKGARNAAVWGTGQLLDAKEGVLGNLGEGYGAAQGFLGQAGDLYGGMVSQAQPGLDRYGTLTLGSGADIQNALEGQGGYQFNMDQGLQALQRTRAAQGMLGSGNTDTDAMSFASGLASNTLGAERAALQPYLNMYGQGVAGQAGVLGTQAGAATDYYGNRASTIDNTAKSIVGLGTEAFKAGDAAKNANQANMINIGTGLLKGATSLASGGLGGFTSLFGGG